MHPTVSGSNLSLFSFGSLFRAFIFESVFRVWTSFDFFVALGSFSISEKMNKLFRASKRIHVEGETASKRLGTVLKHQGWN